MGKVAKVGMLACAVLMLSRSSALAQVAVLKNEGLLNGRYSFGAQGSRPDGKALPGGQISRAGILRFDGIGHVLAVRFIETTDGERRGYGNAMDDYTFVGGEYTVQNNGLGRIVLRFESAYEFIGLPVRRVLEEIWDISLTGDGRGFFLNTASSVSSGSPGDTVGVSENQRGAISGEGRVN